MLQTKKWDILEHLKNKRIIADYLEAALDEDYDYLKIAVNDAIIALRRLANGKKTSKM